MPEIRGITVSVNYGPILRVTLPLNMRHMTECLVITSPDDHETQDIACSVPGVSIFETTAFFEHGAKFNKGYALELGFERMGRHGWIAIFDSDCLWPDEVPFHLLRPNALHGARRRILADPSQWSPDLDWRLFPIHKDGGPIGFMQVFSCDDPVLKDRRPWYNVNSPHAGVGDAEFMEHWSSANRVVLPMEVLHLGQPDQNWWGTDAEGRDMMAAYVHRMGWRGAMRKSDPTAIQRVGELIERVEVPGYPMSDYMMPFEKRAKRLKDQNP